APPCNIQVAASSRLTRKPKKRTLEPVQQRNLGLNTVQIFLCRDAGELLERDAMPFLAGTDALL
ncbi:MAG: hypothetical protein K0R08_2211, partial [Solimicrobium sp.]|nr:hypothetical protein [Solimicrobium sp.]